MRQGFVFSIITLVILCAPAFGIGSDMGLSTEPLTDGSEAYPWLIEDLDDFDTFADPNHAATYWAAGVHTKLMTDIDLAGRIYTTAVIAPDTDTPFSGYFDGNSRSIINLRIEKSGDFNGLFGWISGSSENDTLVQNLELTAPNIIISIGGYTGALVGKMQRCKILNCHSINGAINSTNDIDSATIGGLVGYCIDATLSNCSSSTEIVGGWKDIGGLVGRVESGTLTDCSASGLVSGDATVGGLVGANYIGTLTSCHATGSVSGEEYVGGLAGVNACYGGSPSTYSTIERCYATNTVSGTNYVGGLVGSNKVVSITYGNSVVRYCYATGSVSGNSYIGGLVGHNSRPENSETSAAIITCYSTGLVSGTDYVGGFVGSNSYSWIGSPIPLPACFWDIQTSGTSKGVGNQDPAPDGVTGKTTAEMQTQSTFTDAEWDFVGETVNGTEDIWAICEGTNYPRLACLIPAGDYLCPDGVASEDLTFFVQHWLETDYGTVDGAELTGDGFVGIDDLLALADYWLLSGCGDCDGKDLTGEGNVDLLDFSYLGQRWQQSEYGDCNGAELTGDGIVNIDDFVIFSDNWLKN